MIGLQVIGALTPRRSENEREHWRLYGGAVVFDVQLRGVCLRGVCPVPGVHFYALCGNVVDETSSAPPAVAALGVACSEVPSLSASAVDTVAIAGEVHSRAGRESVSVVV